MWKDQRGPGSLESSKDLCPAEFQNELRRKTRFWAGYIRSGSRRSSTSQYP